MSTQRWMLLLLLLAGMAGVPCATHAGDAAPDDDLGQACAYHRPTFGQASADRPKFRRVADVTVNGVQMPAYSLSLTDGGLSQGGFATYKPDGKTLHVKLKANGALRFDVYAVPDGTIMVPSGWEPRVGALGADGSYYVAFAPDASGRTYFSVSNTAACVGCAYSSASWYFKNARALAKNNGFVYCRSAKGVHSVQLNAVQRAYRIKTAGGNPVDGLAYFNPDDDLMFYEVEIRLPASEHALATAVLNQFVLHRNKI